MTLYQLIVAISATGVAFILMLLAWRLVRFLWIVYKPTTKAEKDEFERKFGIEDIKRKHRSKEL